MITYNGWILTKQGKTILCQFGDSKDVCFEAFTMKQVCTYIDMLSNKE